MTKPKRVRTIDERLRLFDRHVTDVVSESGGHTGWSLTFDFRNDTIESTEPPREPLRSYLMAIRVLDAPTTDPDLFLPNLLSDVETFPITADRRALIGILRQHHATAQIGNGMQLADSEGPITPRVAFELLAYVEHLHRDADKEARFNAMAPAFQELVRQQGHFYANMISNVAMLLRSIARDDPATTHLFAPAPPDTPTAAELLSEVATPAP